MKHELSARKSTYSQTSKNILSNALGAPYEMVLQVPQTLANVEIPASWEDVEYRQATLEAELEQGIAWQVRINREERGLTQLALSKAMKTGQSAISKLENPEGGDVQLSTLIKAAHAFDCALLVQFVSYAAFRTATADVRPDRLLACSFESDKNQHKFISQNGDTFQALLNAL